jgi:hypothetical protein
MLYAPRDIRVEEREDPKIEEPTDAIIRLPVTCVGRWDHRRAIKVLLTV